MKASQYQQNVYNAQVTTNKSIAIEAGPGSGKTTTIVEAAKLVPYGKKAIFLAFNKSIVIELKKRLPAGVECSTMHSLGVRSIFNHYPGENVISDNKQIKYIEPFFTDKHPRMKWVEIYAVDKIMRLARATMTEPNKEAMEKLIDNYALDATNSQANIAVKALKKFYAYNDDPDHYGITVDFQDMIEICVRNKEIRLPQFDFVYVDEAQDLSRLDQLFIKKLVKPVTGRKIIVGDPKQSIYGFRGSDPQSFESFANEPNTIKLPLSISYRCAKNIVREAKTVYPDIEEFDQNEDGVVRKGKLEEIEEGDMVLCRNTRPLISVFLDLVQMGKKAYIVGKDIEKGLLGLLAPFDSSERTAEVRERLAVHLENLKQELKAKGINKPENHPRYVLLQEKIGILSLLFGKFSLVSEVEEFIELIFEDEEREGIQLMTIHKSKGLENDRVFVIEEFDKVALIPSSYAVTSDQIRQETNLRFVAYTRAKKELVKLYL